ncbi:hypothetical protein KVR01_012105 [Diaporthe batatas]|uniref:uncharacterized protein n=1 Tax=Diaporthe batatas TaxID=748121 RepID=UPI001D053B5B|nr:uncharacterized protein KVR01_012105 [Diaporthe batatas]KAG8158344.1 hypothetical protein KVR01_012105 [Diaporthe batatas]
MSGSGGSGSSSQPLDLDDDVVEELRRSYSYYEYFHRGQATQWIEFERGFGAAFVKEWAELPVPRRSNVSDINIPANVQRKPYNKLPLFDGDGDEDEDDDEARERQAARQREIQALQDGTHPTTQALNPLRMRFLKLLGAGSQGTAALFEITEENNQARKIVAKYSTPKSDEETSTSMDLTEEKGRLKVSQGRDAGSHAETDGWASIMSARLIPALLY